MKDSIAAKLQQLTLRLEELNGLLSSETATANMDNYRKLTREYADLTPVVEAFLEFRKAEQDIAMHDADAASVRQAIPEPGSELLSTIRRFFGLNG